MYDPQIPVFLSPLVLHMFLVLQSGGLAMGLPHFWFYDEQHGYIRCRIFELELAYAHLNLF